MTEVQPPDPTRSHQFVQGTGSPQAGSFSVSFDTERPMFLSVIPEGKRFNACQCPDCWLYTSLDRFGGPFAKLLLCFQGRGADPFQRRLSYFSDAECRLVR